MYISLQLYKPVLVCMLHRLQFLYFLALSSVELKGCNNAGKLGAISLEIFHIALCLILLVLH